MRLLTSIWKKISSLGLHPDLSEIEVSRVKITGQFLVIWLIVLVVIYLKLVFVDGVSMTAIYATKYTIIFLFFLLFLTYKQKHELARVISLTGFPFLTFYAVISFGSTLGIEFSFIILMICAVIFLKNVTVKTTLIILNLILYVSSQYYILKVPPPLSYRIDLFTTISIFIVCALTLVIFVAYVIKEYENSLKRKTDFLNTLELQHKELSLAYEDIEQFTYISSHDLKTPLRVIISFIGLLELQKERPFTKTEAKYFDLIKNQAFRMNDLINDILEYSQLSKKEELKTEKVNVESIINQTIAEIRITTGKEITLETSSFPEIISNHTFINLLISNILDNAVKYNTNKVVKIITSYSLEKKFIILFFKDNGIGIEEEFHGQIFEIFKRLHNSTDYSGSGIGLAICKKIVTILGGEINILSQIDKGTTFSIKLPFQ